MTATLDPITFGVLRHKLNAIIDEAYYSIGQVSGNPVVVEGGDHQEAICTPDGDLAIFGGGVLHWFRSLGAGVRHLIESYAENPGFAEDDQFVLNDPYIASVHHSDVQVHAPVFHDGELIAWAATASHQTDVGGIDPGSICVSAQNIYQEGLRAPGIKFVEKGIVRKDVEDLIRRTWRSPEIGLLDLRAKVAANNIMKRRLVEMADRYGRETVAVLFEQLIDYSEERLSAKLRAIPNGRWRSVNYIEGRREPTFRVQLEAVKQDDRLTFDFSGTCAQTAGPENICSIGAIGAVVAPMISMLGHDIPWNEGLFKHLDFVLPEASIVNPRAPAAVSAAMPGGACVLTVTAALNVVSKMLYSCEAFREEACGNVTGNFAAINVSGTWPDGRYFSTVDMDHLAGGTGGYLEHDGAHGAQNPYSVKTMIPNVETIEMLYPLLYLWRKVTPDSGGPGEFRGGAGLDTALAPWGADHVDVVVFSVGGDPRSSLGFSGGYPGANTPVGALRDVGLRAAVAAHRQIPADLEEIESPWERLPPKGITHLGADDVIHQYVSAGGGGFGDPLERDTELVAADVASGYVSPGAAKQVYGVAIDALGMVDVAETESLRRALIDERLRKGATAASTRRGEPRETHIERGITVVEEGD